MRITFLGAAGTVTGSSYLLTANSGEHILVDLGMFQGPPEIEKLNFSNLPAEIAQLSGVVLTHAHLDHCGRLPMLARHHFQGPIWMTRPTADLVELSLFDSAKIAQEDFGEHALYTHEDVKKILQHCKTTSYHTTFTVGPFSVRLFDAGHILGSASAEIIDLSAQNQKKYIFSGDLGNTPEELVQPTESITQGNVVIMESTYGDRIHPHETPSEKIISEVRLIEQQSSTLLIPAFSLERAQELLHIIAHAKQNHQIKIDTPIFLDSPMAEKATEIYSKYPSMFNLEVQADFRRANPFDFPGLFVTQKPQDGVLIAKTPGAKVIIAGSGMMTGGRIINHAASYLPHEQNRILFVGYQGEQTLGRAILDGEKNVTIRNTKIQIRASVSQTQAMSSHADQPRLLNWLNTIHTPTDLILTHGEDLVRDALAEKIKSTSSSIRIHTPHLHDQLTLD